MFVGVFASFLMSVFHNGLLRTMKAHYTVAEGDLRVIRPLVYLREKSLRDFAETEKLPIIAENCPACFEQPKVFIDNGILVPFKGCVVKNAYAFLNCSPLCKDL